MSNGVGAGAHAVGEYIPGEFASGAAYGAGGAPNDDCGAGADGAANGDGGGAN